MLRPLTLGALAAMVFLAACPQSSNSNQNNGGDCADCLKDSDCKAGDVCVQVGASSGCLPECENGFCEGGGTCSIKLDNAGLQKEVCVGTQDPCAAFSCESCPAGTTCNAIAKTCVPNSGNGITGGPQLCGVLASPEMNGVCCKCPTGQSCANNGCLGGWWCDTSKCACAAPPATCSNPNPPPPNGGWDGQPVTGTVGNAGGTVSRLLFAVIGDTRPANEWKSSSDESRYPYPSQVISTIYQDVTGLSPRPSFVISTGDYMYADPSSNMGARQIALYQQAEQVFPNPVFHALGNHECTGYTVSECGPNGRDGNTNSYEAFLNAWVKPLGYNLPYYALHFTGSDGKWTAKIILVAANAWDSTQANWLQGQLSQPTTFTFVVRHEPPDTRCSNGSCPWAQSESLIRSHPLTLEINGHTHTFYFEKSSPSFLIVGNGGAPSSGSGSQGFGYATVSQISDTQVVVSQFDYSSPNATPSRTWTIDANGTIH